MDTKARVTLHLGRQNIKLQMSKVEVGFLPPWQAEPRAPAD